MGKRSVRRLEVGGETRRHSRGAGRPLEVGKTPSRSWGLQETGRHGKFATRAELDLQ